MRYAVVLVLSIGWACAGGCASKARKDFPPAPDYSMRLSGYDVSRPPSVPYDDPRDVQEYLIYYHQAFLCQANDPYVVSSGNIEPNSPRVYAAQKGSYDGQRDGRGAKEAYWREQGRPLQHVDLPSIETTQE